MRFVVVILLFFSKIAVAQQDIVDTAKYFPGAERDPKNNSRKWLIGGASVAGYGTSLVVFNEAWYKDYPRSRFHAFNDAREWQQMDKLGHAWAAYHTSRFTSNMWEWAGVSRNNAVLLGSGSSLLYLLSIEYLDGRSAEWGWSWADVAADILGGALFYTQEFGWREQKLHLKFSAFPKKYDPALKLRADDLYGNSFEGKLLKDYNAQTYWLSANLKSIFPKKNIPSWLNISLGYGAEGMYGGFENTAYDDSGNLIFDRRDIRRYRQWFLSPDIDLTKIKTNSKLLRSILSLANILKIPAPALEFSDGRFKLRALAY